LAQNREDVTAQIEVKETQPIIFRRLVFSAPCFNQSDDLVYFEPTIERRTKEWVKLLGFGDKGVAPGTDLQNNLIIFLPEKFDVF
jgi:hypothetical protein